MRSKSSMSRATPASWAMANRCSTALVDPPVAATEAMAFSSACRVTICRGVRCACNRSMTSLPAATATSARSPAVAGTLALPMGEMPRNSAAVAMVLAVNCPPQAPAPGQAAFSRALSCSSDIRPAL